MTTWTDNAGSNNMKSPDIARHRCWQGMNSYQQWQLVITGGFVGYSEEPGTCPLQAQVAVECDDDRSPGPRYLCLAHAILYLQAKRA